MSRSSNNSTHLMLISCFPVVPAALSLSIESSERWIVAAQTNTSAFAIFLFYFFGKREGIGITKKNVDTQKKI